MISFDFTESGYNAALTSNGHYVNIETDHIFASTSTVTCGDLTACGDTACPDYISASSIHFTFDVDGTKAGFTLSVPFGLSEGVCTDKDALKKSWLIYHLYNLDWFGTTYTSDWLLENRNYEGASFWEDPLFCNYDSSITDDMLTCYVKLDFIE